MERPALHDRLPAIAACLAVGLLVGGLLVGYEPVGGDPDRIFRPIKAELSEALREWRLPFWSERLGLGVPLVAESHVGAYYPPNWVLYRVLSVSTAYRLSMWLHCVAIAAATFAYSRQIGNSQWGSALAALAYPFCGFLTVHSSHEWAYQNLAYLPICLLASDRYAQSGKLGWLAGLALLWGVQITLGHFQVQMWTAGLSLVLGIWRVVADRQPRRRIVVLGLGLAWGAAVAAAQLVPSWELAQLVGQTNRSFAELAYYSYPPGHWSELAVPALFRGLAGGSEAPYWFTQQTTGFEASLFVGTIPLLLAAVGAFGGGKGMTPWRLVVPLSFALATMPRWWPQGYAIILQVPGLGYFRCPARYTAISSFGLVLLAGRGLDRTIATSRFRAAIGVMLLFEFGALAWTFAWVARHPDLRAEVGGDVGLMIRVGLAVVSWLLAFGLVVRWRSRNEANRPWGLLLVTAAELGGFYYVGGTTQWGWSVPLPESSPVLKRLAEEKGRVRVGGVLDNLPLRAGLATATPYTGFPLLPPHPLLKRLQEPLAIDDPVARRWLRRYGVTHLVSDGSLKGDEVYRGNDPALDILAYRPFGSPARRTWRIVGLPEVFPEARVALKTFTASDRPALLDALSRRDATDEAWFLAADRPRESNSPRARSAKVIRWEGWSGEVEHDGSCDLVLTRAFYPGWQATRNNGEPIPVQQADGGLISIHLEGAGTDRIRLDFHPKSTQASWMISGIAIILAAGTIAVSYRRSGP